jgi:hypothetical protein
VTERIQSTFIDAVRGRVDAYKDWLTYVDA